MEINTEKNFQSIHREKALKICEEIRKEKGVKLFSQCWGCLKFSKNDPDKMCFSGVDNRGCKLVNELHNKRLNT